MTNIVLAAAIAMSPSDFSQLTNRIDILWAEHTNRVARIEELRENRKRREAERNGPPNKPYRLKKVPYRPAHFPKEGRPR